MNTTLPTTLYILYTILFPRYILNFYKRKKDESIELASHFASLQRSARLAFTDYLPNNDRNHDKRKETMSRMQKRGWSSGKKLSTVPSCFCTT